MPRWWSCEQSELSSSWNATVSYYAKILCCCRSICTIQVHKNPIDFPLRWCETVTSKQSRLLCSHLTRLASSIRSTKGRCSSNRRQLRTWNWLPAWLRTPVGCLCWVSLPALIKTSIICEAFSTALSLRWVDVYWDHQFFSPFLVSLVELMDCTIYEFRCENNRKSSRCHPRTTM